MLPARRTDTGDGQECQESLIKLPVPQPRASRCVKRQLSSELDRASTDRQDGYELVDEGVRSRQYERPTLSELVSSYEGTGGRSWVFTDPELEALIDRVTEVAVRRVLAEQEPAPDN